MHNETLGINEFGQAVGGLVHEYENLVADALARNDFSYRNPSDSERDRIIVGVLDRIRKDTQIVGDNGRKSVWDVGWGENLSMFQIDSDAGSLIPKFMRASQAIRWRGKYVIPSNPHFEIAFAEALRAFVCGVFLSYEVAEIHEFGAGTGWNLVDFARLLSSNGGPTIELFGSDFVPSSVELMSLLEGKFGVNLRPRLFDMKHPDYSYALGSTGPAGVFTFGSIEQLAGDFEPMIDFLLEKNPNVVVSIEPDIDTYDLESLEDYLAKWFQAKRGYSAGLISHLRSLEASGRLVIERAKRVGFGSVMMEGYNLIIWRPLG